MTGMRLTRHPRPASLELPRFTLRTLFLGIAATSSLFALMSMIGAIWSAALAWALLMIGCHVLGNAWGSKTFHSRGSQHEIEEAVFARRRPTDVTVVKPTRVPLGQAAAGGRPRYVASMATALALALVGVTISTILFWQQASVAAVLVWMLSFAVVGAIVGFVASGFWQALDVIAESADGEGR